MISTHYLQFHSSHSLSNLSRQASVPPLHWNHLCQRHEQPHMSKSVVTSQTSWYLTCGSSFFSSFIPEKPLSLGFLLASFFLHCPLSWVLLLFLICKCWKPRLSPQIPSLLYQHPLPWWSHPVTWLEMSISRSELPPELWTHIQPPLDIFMCVSTRHHDPNVSNIGALVSLPNCFPCSAPAH